MTEKGATRIARWLSLPALFPGLRRKLRRSIKYSLWIPAEADEAARREEFLARVHLERECPERFALPECGAPVVSIIVPAYNHYELTRMCLYTILKNSGDVPYEVILADDASTDQTKDIRDYIGGVIVARTQGNLRFLRNCNNAAKLARGKYVLFLNNDTQVQKDWLKPLVELMESDPKIGLVGSQFLNADLSIQEAGAEVLPDGGTVGFGCGHPAAWRRPFNEIRDVDFVCGASLMLSRALWERLGGFAEEFAPAYYEDTDLAYRVRAAGYRVVYQPDSKVIHLCGASSPEGFTSGQRESFYANRSKFVAKWLSTR